jgi:hypothetical protein
MPTKPTTTANLLSLDAALIRWMNGHGRQFLRLALAVIFV